jgi:hypothetical protein
MVTLREAQGDTTMIERRALIRLGYEPEGLGLTEEDILDWDFWGDTDPPHWLESQMPPPPEPKKPRKPRRRPGCKGRLLDKHALAEALPEYLTDYRSVERYDQAGVLVPRERGNPNLYDLEDSRARLKRHRAEGAKRIRKGVNRREGEA